MLLLKTYKVGRSLRSHSHLAASAEGDAELMLDIRDFFPHHIDGNVRDWSFAIGAEVEVDEGGTYCTSTIIINLARGEDKGQRGRNFAWLWVDGECTSTIGESEASCRF